MKECVQAKTSETRWMVGGTNHGKMAGATEIRAQRAVDVPVQDVPDKALPGLSEGLCGRLRAVGGMVTRQALPRSGARSLRVSMPISQDFRLVLVPGAAARTVAQVGPSGRGRIEAVPEYTDSMLRAEAANLGHSAMETG